MYISLPLPFIVMAIQASAIDSSWMYDLITLALDSFNENNNHCMVSQNKRTKNAHNLIEPFKTNALECVYAYVYVAYTVIATVVTPLKP